MTAWADRKARVRERSGGICERCHVAFASHVHHLRYGGRRGTEPIEWLQHVCLACHTFYHPGHEFLPKGEQLKRAQENAVSRRRRVWSCGHCGGAFSRAKHRAICIQHGLNAPRSKYHTVTK